MLEHIKQVIKKKLCSRWGIPYTRFGIAHPLYGYLEGRSDITFIDIGAHDGHFSRTVAACCPVKRGILIEPISDKALRLKGMFGAPDFEVLDCLISDTDGEVEFEINELSETSSILHIKEDIPAHAKINTNLREKVMKQSRTLDSLIDELDIGKVDLLKVDVQGAEHLVLKGARKSLPKVEMIWTEVSFKPLYEGSSTFVDIYNFLTEHGYIFAGMAPVFYSHGGELLQSDALFISNRE